MRSPRGPNNKKTYLGIAYMDSIADNLYLVGLVVEALVDLGQHSTAFFESEYY